VLDFDLQAPFDRNRAFATATVNARDTSSRIAISSSVKAMGAMRLKMAMPITFSRTISLTQAYERTLLAAQG
jgi:hypothetical protein